MIKHDFWRIKKVKYLFSLLGIIGISVLIEAPLAIATDAVVAPRKADPSPAETATPARVTEAIQCAAGKISGCPPHYAELQFKRPSLPTATGQSAEKSEQSSQAPDQIKETFNPLDFGAHTADAGTTAFGIKVMGLVEQNPLGTVGAIGTQTGIDLASSVISPAACVQGKTVARMAGQIGGVNNILHIMLQGAGMVINPPLAILAGIAAGTGMSYALFDKTRLGAVRDCYGEPVAITLQLPESIKPQTIVDDPLLQEIAPQFSYARWKLYPNDHNELTVQLGENTLKRLPKWVATHPEFAQKYHIQDWQVSLIISTEEYDFSNHAEENKLLVQDQTQAEDKKLASARELWQANEVSGIDRFGGR